MIRSPSNSSVRPPHDAGEVRVAWASRLLRYLRCRPRDAALRLMLRGAASRHPEPADEASSHVTAVPSVAAAASSVGDVDGERSTYAAVLTHELLGCARVCGLRKPYVKLPPELVFTPTAFVQLSWIGGPYKEEGIARLVDAGIRWLPGFRVLRVWSHPEVAELSDRIARAWGVRVPIVGPRMSMSETFALVRGLTVHERPMGEMLVDAIENPDRAIPHPTGADIAGFLSHSDHVVREAAFRWLAEGR